MWPWREHGRYRTLFDKVELFFDEIPELSALACKVNVDEMSQTKLPIVARVRHVANAASGRTVRFRSECASMRRKTRVDPAGPDRTT